MTEWWQVQLPGACFGVAVAEGRIITVAPVGHWMLGKKWADVLRWIHKRGGTAEVTTKPQTREGATW